MDDHQFVDCCESYTIYGRCECGYQKQDRTVRRYKLVKQYFFVARGTVIEKYPQGYYRIVPIGKNVNFPQFIDGDIRIPGNTVESQPDIFRKIKI